jgi:hypothetical protein
MKLARCDRQAGYGARPCDVTVPFTGTCHGHAVTHEPFRGCHVTCHAVSRGMSRGLQETERPVRQRGRCGVAMWNYVWISNSRPDEQQSGAHRNQYKAGPTRFEPKTAGRSFRF